MNKKILHGVIQILNKRLCDEYILFTKTRNYHWNVVGPNFSEKHKFFQEQYEQIDEVIDEIVERARTLNDRSLCTLAEFVEHGSIQESLGKYPDEWTMISNLLADHEQIVRSLRTDADKCEEYHDMGTNDFFDWCYGKREKMA